MTLRVLHVHAGNLYGGVESMLVTLANESRAAERAGIAFTFALSFEERLATELRAAGAKVTILGPVRVRKPLSVLRARRRLRSLLRSEPFDVAILHASWSQALFGGVVRAAKVPLAFYMHGPAQVEHWIDRLAERVTPDLVLYNSEHTRRTARLFADAPGLVVRYPLSPRPPATVDRAALRRSLGAGDDEIVILQASRLDPWKGHALHLDALARLRTRRPWRAWFAGGAQRPEEVPVFEALRARAAEPAFEGRVSFLGQRSDVAALMSAADVFCQPNTGPEPFGLVFVEALRAGLPVVSTAMGGALEIVDATCGLLVPPEAQDVAAALGSLVDDEARREHLGGAGPARARALTDPEHQLGELERALRPHARSART